MARDNNVRVVILDKSFFNCDQREVVLLNKKPNNEILKVHITISHEKDIISELHVKNIYVL